MTNSKNTPYLFATSGDGQSTTALKSFATPLQVLLTSYPGFPMPNIEVTFLIVVPEGSNASASFQAGSQVLESSATTDANGYATCPSFTTGSSAGKLHVMVLYLSAEPVTFHLTVLPLPIASINVINGNNQQVSSTQKAQFATLQVRLLDTARNPAFDNDASSRIQDDEVS